MTSTSSEERYVAVDLGASSGRVAVGILRDGRMELEIVHRFATGPVRIRGHLYWDVLGFWREIVTGTTRAVASTGAASIGVDSWAADFALLSESDELLGGVHHYRDGRTTGMIDEAWRIVPRHELYERTGLQFIAFNTLYQLMAVQRTSPELLELASSLLFIPDLINFWLCGNRSTEATMASTTQMVDAGARSWSEELAASFALPIEILPPIQEPGTVLGPLTAEVAKAVGSGNDMVVVAPGEHDTASAVAATPARGGEDWAYISCGTWSLVGVETHAPVISAAGMEYNLTNEVGIHGTTRVLKNVMGLWLLQECERAWGVGDPSELLEAAKLTPAFAGFIDPNDNRFFAPGRDMPERILGYCAGTGQPPPQSRGSMVRYILESLALTYALTTEKLEEITGRQLEVVHIVGGGSKNELLCQWTADATGRQVVAGPGEATLLGNLLVQAEAMGHLRGDELRPTVRRSARLHYYEPRDRDAWSDAAGRFRRLLDVERETSSNRSSSESEVHG